MFDTIIDSFKKLTEAGLALIALAIVLQVIFGGSVPFVGGDVIGTITVIVDKLGAQGLVGLAAVAVIYSLFTKQ